MIVMRVTRDVYHGAAVRAEMSITRLSLSFCTSRGHAVVVLLIALVPLPSTGGGGAWTERVRSWRMSSLAPSVVNTARGREARPICSRFTRQTNSARNIKRLSTASSTKHLFS
nr:hypothetical protein CFP56_28853 [Quercus suber]